MANPRLLIRNAAVAIFRFIGSDVIDQRTGKRVGRAFFFGWKGRVIVIGLENEPPLRPIFLPQERLTYWKQEIGFSSPPQPDFPPAPIPAQSAESRDCGMLVQERGEPIRNPQSAIPHSPPPPSDSPPP